MNHEDMKRIIENTFKDMIQMTEKPNAEEGWPKLIWPKYSPFRKSAKNVEIRFSEQELKQRFIVQLEDSLDKFFYSVETPTIDGYRFSGDYPMILHHDNGGQSGNFDLTIYDSNQVIQHHIEFKSGTPASNEITKDLLKLCNEPYCYDLPKYKKNALKKEEDAEHRYHYFIHMLDRFGSNTLESLEDKILPTNTQLKEEMNACLNNSRNNICVFILVLTKEKSGYYEFNYVEQKEDKQLKQVISQVISHIDWNFCWYKYDGKDFKKEM